MSICCSSLKVRKYSRAALLTSCTSSLEILDQLVPLNFYKNGFNNPQRLFKAEGLKQLVHNAHHIHVHVELLWEVKPQFPLEKIFQV